ncbi:hypothetical protein G97194_004746 [Escherichia coli]|nr:hypothetical protein G97194_004746 [Escherichia coli]
MYLLQSWLRFVFRHLPFLIFAVLIWLCPGVLVLITFFPVMVQVLVIVLLPVFASDFSSYSLIDCLVSVRGFIASSAIVLTVEVFPPPKSFLHLWA